MIFSLLSKRHKWDSLCLIWAPVSSLPRWPSRTHKHTSRAAPINSIYTTGCACTVHPRNSSHQHRALFMVLFISAYDLFGAMNHFSQYVRIWSHKHSKSIHSWQGHKITQYILNFKCLLDLNWSTCLKQEHNFTYSHNFILHYVIILTQLFLVYFLWM